MQPVNNIVKEIESVLKTGQKIEISFDHPSFLEEYPAEIESVRKDALGIIMPIAGRVPDNTHCWIYLEYKNQRYGFETTVRGYQGRRPVLMLLKRPAEVLRLQRRRYFRVPVDLPVTFRISRRSKQDPEGIFTGSIRNISTGGALIVSEAELPLGGELLLFFSLREEVDLQDIPARIVRGGIVEKKKTKAFYEYGIEFYDIHTLQKNTIMRFVLNRQIELNQLRHAAKPQI